MIPDDDLFVYTPGPLKRHRVETPRQAEIRGLIMQGLDYKQIAERLGIRRSSVKNHITKIFEVWNVKTRFQLMAKVAGVR